jgi:NAD(P)H dehydrogenase (quinone)
LTCSVARPGEADDFLHASFYSTYGHITQLAEKIVEGVRAAGAEPVVYQMWVVVHTLQRYFVLTFHRYPFSQETLSEEILSKMYAGGSLKPKYPIIKPADLKELWVLGIVGIEASDW